MKVVDRATGKSTNTMFPTEIEARSAVRRLRRKAEGEIGISIDGALMTYEKHLTEKGNKPLSICSTLERLRSLFKDQTHYVVALTCEDAARIWNGYAARPTRTGKPPAVDTRINVLHEAKTFMRWCLKQRWTKVAEPFAGVEILGERSRGKDQLERVDDARRWLATASAGVLYGQGLSPTQQEITNFNSISTGSFTISIDGASHNITGVNFTAALSSATWSPIDCRVNKPNSATFRTVQGAQICDVQTSSNPAVPGVDSRAAGKPQDCRVAPNIPENSRTFPPFAD